MEHYIKNGNYTLINLEDYFNGDGISYDSNRADGAFGVSCFPAEELPESNKIITVEGIPFIFPSKEDGHKNNIELFDQHLEIKKGLYHEIYFLGGSDNGSFEEKVKLVYENKTEVRKLGLSDWIIPTSVFNEKLAFKCSHAHGTDMDYNFQVYMWLQRMELDCSQSLQTIVFPNNICMHVFAISLKHKEEL